MLDEFDNDEEVEYKCIKCGDKIDSLEALQRHLSVDHMRWVPYECLYCDVFKATEMELRDHVTQRHPDKPVKLVVSSDAANQQQLRKLISQSTTRKCTHCATTTPVEMCVSGEAEQFVSSPSRCCQIEGVRQPFTIDCIKVEFVDLSQEEPSLKLSPPHTSETSEADEILANESAARRQDEHARRAFDTPAAKSSGPPRKRHRMSRPLFHQLLDKSRCRLCQVHIDPSSGSPVKHVYYKHMEEKAIVCKYCGFGVRYTIADIRRHIRRRHPRDVVESGIVDKRQQLEPTVHAWMQRCFGTDDNEVAVEASSATPTSQNFLKKRRMSTRQCDRTGTTTAVAWHCLVCQVNISEHPNQHVYTKHIRAKVWRCKLCNYGTARRGCLKVHLRLQHATDGNPKTFVDDRREQFRQQFEQWHKRCFDETMATSAAACSADAPLTDQPVRQAHADNHSDHTDAMVHVESLEYAENPPERDKSNNSDSNSFKQLTPTYANKSGCNIGGSRSDRPSSVVVPKRRQSLCRLCNLMVTADTRHAQIWHLNETLYECLVCGAKSNASPSAVRQLHSAKGCTAEVTDHSDKHQDSLSALYKSCFG